MKPVKRTHGTQSKEKGSYHLIDVERRECGVNREAIEKLRKDRDHWELLWLDRRHSKTDVVIAALGLEPQAKSRSTWPAFVGPTSASPNAGRCFEMI
jgi:hypothetical protein